MVIALVAVGALAYLGAQAGPKSNPTPGSSTSALVSTSSCTSTSLSISSPASPPPSLISTLSSYDSQTVNTYAALNGKQVYASSQSFDVVYRSPTTYKVDSTSNLTGSVAQGASYTSYTSWILANGTALAVYGATDGQPGYNQTGASANTILEQSALSGFYLGVSFSQGVGYFANESEFLHPNGTSTVTLGQNKLTATTYVPALGVTYAYCGLEAVTYDSYYLEVGTPQGATTPLVTNLAYSGTLTVNGTTSAIDYAFETTAFTVA